MKILVTGGAGFIGSHIVDAYVALGHKVWVIDDQSSGKPSQVNRKARYSRMDVTDKKKLAALFKRRRFDVVNHHAAQIDVRRSVREPEFDAQINIMGLLNVLKQCRETGVKKIIFSSSGGTVYGECSRGAATEASPEVPLSPYGVSKLASEKYIIAQASLTNLKYTVLRYSNVYGPRQDPHGEAGVVAIFAQRLLKNEPISIFGDGRQTRDFVYVKDVARANVLALTRANNQIINIGTGKSTSVNELHSTMASILGLQRAPVLKPARPGELFRSLLNIGKAKSILGWSPKTSIRKGLEETILFFTR